MECLWLIYDIWFVGRYCWHGTFLPNRSSYHYINVFVCPTFLCDIWWISICVMKGSQVWKILTINLLFLKSTASSGNCKHITIMWYNVEWKSVKKNLCSLAIRKIQQCSCSCSLKTKVLQKEINIMTGHTSEYGTVRDTVVIGAPDTIHMTVASFILSLLIVWKLAASDIALHKLQTATTMHPFSAIIFTSQPHKQRIVDIPNKYTIQNMGLTRISQFVIYQFWSWQTISIFKYSQMTYTGNDSLHLKKSMKILLC